MSFEGSESPDTIGALAAGELVQVTGLGLAVRIAHPEAASDRLAINGLAKATRFPPAPACRP